MIEHGRVIEVKDGSATVEMQRGASCGRCSMCSMGQGGKMQLEAEAPVEVKVGDEVDVEVPTNVWRSIILVFVLPLGGVVAGALFGSWLAGVYQFTERGRNLLAIGMALAFVIVIFVVVAIIERRIACAPGNKPRIVRTP